MASETKKKHRAKLLAGSIAMRDLSKDLIDKVRKGNSTNQQMISQCKTIVHAAQYFVAAIQEDNERKKNKPKIYVPGE